MAESFRPGFRKDSEKTCGCSATHRATAAPVAELTGRNGRNLCVCHVVCACVCACVLLGEQLGEVGGSLPRHLSSVKGSSVGANRCPAEQLSPSLEVNTL